LGRTTKKAGLSPGDRKMQQQGNGSVIFRETQWFQPRWLWVLVLGTATLIWYIGVKHRLLHMPYRSSSNFDTAYLISWVILGVLAPLFMCSYRQVTEIRDDGIYVVRGPMPRVSEVIRFSQFYRYQPRNCSPIYSAGGWGIAEGWQGKSYNMGGSHGVELCLTDGGRVLIGSCKLRQFLDVLHSQCRNRARKPAQAV
jgi:hypothetical protein